MATPHENQNDAEQKKKAKKAEKRQRKKESKPKYQKKIKRQHAQKNQQAAERFAQTHHGLLSLNRFNTLILHLFLTPVMTLIYYPLNRYVFLPLLRDGQPYISTNGETGRALFQRIIARMGRGRCLVHIDIDFVSSPRAWY